MCLRIFILLSILAVFCFCTACEQKTGETMDSLNLVVRTPLELQAGSVVRTPFFKGHGPLISDKVRLKAVDGGTDYTFPISELGDDYFTFTIGDSFNSGTYEFLIVRGSQEKSFGKVVYTFIANSDLKPADGATVYGIVSCNGKGVSGVKVSDGYYIVVTDRDGVYQLSSQKANGYVFLTIPSGYEVAATGILPQFSQHTRQAAGVPERIDFTLYEAGDQTNHEMLIFGDMHLAGGKQNDRTQFAKFTGDVNAYLTANASKKIYGLTLGDMTWDLYWYSRNYCFKQYLADINTIKGLQIFHCMGNHDHDMNATGDWDTAMPFKLGLDKDGKDDKDLYNKGIGIGPNYYSFDIGKVHYIVLDDIVCTNATASTTNGDYRTYLERVSTEGINWLRKDLAYVGKSTPVVVAMHAPLYDQSGNQSLGNASELVACFTGFENVRFVTGHSHKIWNVDKGSIHENNTGAVCGAWWWGGSFNATLNVAQDGAPAGYRIMDVKDKTMTSTFKATGRDAGYQFRTYDRNSILLNPADYGVSAYASECSSYLTTYGAYNSASSANEVLLNVWDYDPTWSIDVTENGKKLDVSRVSAYDPLYLITYAMQRFKSSSSFGFNPSKTSHMFKVTASSPTSTLEIKVTDDEGRVYTETMTRPKSFGINTYK